MRRANYIPAPAYFELNMACRTIAIAYGTAPYLVGSCVETRDFRDVDVRLILDDADFARRFPIAAKGDTSADPLWSLTCASVALWLRTRTGLPVDFQIQSTKEAARYPLASNYRYPIGVFDESQPTSEPTP